MISKRKLWQRFAKTWFSDFTLYRLRLISGIAGLLCILGLGVFGIAFQLLQANWYAPFGLGLAFTNFGLYFGFTLAVFSGCLCSIQFLLWAACRIGCRYLRPSLSV
jgi:hypothetical protein